MLHRLFVSFFLFIAILYSFPALAGSPAEETGEEKKFQPGDMIMHHILDAHDWHILDWKGHAVSIPLPIILFHEGAGLKVFMSSKFNHGHSAYMGYKLDHGNIVAINDDGSKNELETKKIWDFSITKNVFSLFLSILILLIVFIGISNKYKKHKNQAPSGAQSLLEPIVIFVRDDIAKSAIGEKDYQKYLPFLLTVFFFIFLNNLLGLVPFFPGGANLTGNIAVPMVMAAMVFIITTLSGRKYYWQHIFAMPGVPKPVLLILTPIEIFGVFLKPLVLMIRLFANITAGHIIILSFFSMIFIFGEMHPLAGYGVSVFSGLFVLFMMVLELLVAFLQAYVFTLLAAMYFGMAVEEH
jgi:F-type H+-transporting ATPase subunit a